MNLRTFLALAVCSITTSIFASDLPVIPDTPIAQKKELLFSDDFEGAEPAKVWHKVVPTFTVEKGMLKGTQTRERFDPPTSVLRLPMRQAAGRSRAECPPGIKRHPAQSATASAGQSVANASSQVVSQEQRGQRILQVFD